MKGRIEAALRKRLDAMPTDARLQAQLAQIDRAQVSTLHGFCSRLLRQHFHLVGLDPAFKILDADEATLLRAEIARDLFDERYRDRRRRRPFQQFVDDYGDGNDDALQAARRPHPRAALQPDRPRRRGSRRAGRLDEGAAGNRCRSALGRELAAIIRAEAGGRWPNGAPRRSRPFSRSPGFAKYVRIWRICRACSATGSSAFGDGNFDALATAVRGVRARPTCRVANAVARQGGSGGGVRIGARGWAKRARWSRSSGSTTARVGRGAARASRRRRMFLDLVERVRQAYRAAKERARGIDFADLERLTLRCCGIEARSLARRRWRGSATGRFITCWSTSTRTSTRCRTRSCGS